MDWKIIIAVLLAYLVGSVPTSVWVGKLFFGKDVRSYGSGNAGATNTIRVLGTPIGIFVLLFDGFKGWFAVYLAHFFYNINYSEIQHTNLEIAMALAAVIGHIYPLFAGFKGGKGVATSLGTALALFPGAFLLTIIIFLIVFIITRYVSLGSIISALMLPIFVWLVFNENLSLIIFACAVAVFIPLTHKKNIRRLLKGEESKFSFVRKKES